MVPDSVESRLLRLEREASALQQRVVDIANDVENLAPVKETIVEIRGDVRNVCDQIANLRTAVAEDRAAAKARGEQMAREMKERDERMTSEIERMRESAVKDARANRRQLLQIAGSIITTMILVGVPSIVAVLTQ